MKVEFTGSLPPIQSAISVSGTSEGARIKIDVPQSEMEAVLKLQLLAGYAFKVTIEPIG